MSMISKIFSLEEKNNKQLYNIYDCYIEKIKKTNRRKNKNIDNWELYMNLQKEEIFYSKVVDEVKAELNERGYIV